MSYPRLKPVDFLLLQPDSVPRKLDAKMTKAFWEVVEAMEEFKDKNVDPRIAAYVVAVRRVVEAMKARGWV